MNKKKEAFRRLEGVQEVLKTLSKVAYLYSDWHYKWQDDNLKCTVRAYGGYQGGTFVDIRLYQKERWYYRKFLATSWRVNHGTVELEIYRLLPNILSVMTIISDNLNKCIQRESDSIQQLSDSVADKRAINEEKNI